MTKMIKDRSSAWVRPRDVEELQAEGWSLTDSPDAKQDELKVTLRPIKRSNK
jgi:hypothetical protein